MTHFRATLLTLAMLSMLGAAMANTSQGNSQERDALIQIMLGKFWGNARNIRGEPIQPDSEQDRVTVPVSKAVAYRALDAGDVSGHAEWCGLDWEPHYFALTRAARDLKMVDKQVAFISVLHGAAQGGFVRKMEGKLCTEVERSRARIRLTESSKVGIPRPADPPQT